MSRPTAMTCAIERAHGQMFSKPRTPRSDAYKHGARAGLASEIAREPVHCPWRAPSAEFDAFHAGLEEGRTVGRAVARNDIEQLLRLSIEPYMAPVAA